MIPIERAACVELPSLHALEQTCFVCCGSTFQTASSLSADASSGNRRQSLGLRRASTRVEQAGTEGQRYRKRC